MAAEIKTHTFKGAKPGPHLLALGAIHGNETCGTEAIGRLIAEIEAGAVHIDAGTLTCAPICNPEAYARQARFIHENLNRIIRWHDAPACAEHTRANEVTKLIDNADILLDLHSYSAGMKPFLFLDKEDDAHRAYAAALDIPYWVAGWNEAYAAVGDLNDGDTVSYAHSKGKLATLVECGIHTDRTGGYVGYQCLRRALGYFGLTEAYAQIPLDRPHISRLSLIVAKNRDGDFTRDWQHLDPVRAGEIVARYDDGEGVTAPHDGVIILPHRGAALGNEWVYFGRVE